jgi:flagellar motor protein MotB
MTRFSAFLKNSSGTSASSSASKPLVRARDVMQAIGALLNDVDNAISLAGHTDAVQYAGGERGYSNWELSADRANASIL